MTLTISRCTAIFFLCLTLTTSFFFFFFFNDTATTEIYTLSLHDALPISVAGRAGPHLRQPHRPAHRAGHQRGRSEEHTSELQSPCNLVCRLLLEKKKKIEEITRPQDHALRFYSCADSLSAAHDSNVNSLA